MSGYEAPFLITAAFIAATLIPNPAFGQPHCVPRDHVLTHLLKKYQEQPIAMGLANNGGIIEVLVSPDGNSWTIMITMPNQISCIVSAGEGWELIPIKLGESS